MHWKDFRSLKIKLGCIFLPSFIKSKPDQSALRSGKNVRCMVRACLRLSIYKYKVRSPSASVSASLEVKTWTAQADSPPPPSCGSS
jgi:hypothetical protein